MTSLQYRYDHPIKYLKKLDEAKEITTRDADLSSVTDPLTDEWRKKAIHFPMGHTLVVFFLRLHPRRGGAHNCLWKKKDIAAISFLLKLL